MGGLGRIFGGLLEGVGAGMEQQATMDAQTRRDDALYRRQVALQNLENDQAIGREDRAQTNRLELDTHQTGNRMIATSAELKQRGQLAAQDDDRALQLALAKEDRDYKLWVAKHSIEQRDQLTLEDFRQTRQDARESKQQAGTSSRSTLATGVDAEGNVVVLRPDGSLMTAHGMKPLPRATPGMDFAGLYAQGGAGTAAPAPAPAARGGGLLNQPAPAKPNTYTVSDFNEALAEAGRLKAQGDPRFKNMTPDQIRTEIKGWFEQRGLRLSTNGR